MPRIISPDPRQVGEDVVVDEANVGSILGIGFPRWTEGVIRYINGYPGGIEAFAARVNELARE